MDPLSRLAQTVEAQLKGIVKALPRPPRKPPLPRPGRQANARGPPLDPKLHRHDLPRARQTSQRLTATRNWDTLRWYHQRFGATGPRMRGVGVVALARKLLVDLCRYLETGRSREERRSERPDLSRQRRQRIRRVDRVLGSESRTACQKEPSPSAFAVASKTTMG